MGIAKGCVPLLHLETYLATLVLVLVLRFYDWVGLLIASFHCQLANLMLSPGNMKARTQERGFGVRSCSNSPSPGSEVHVIFSNKDFNFLETNGNSNSLY